MLDFKLAQARFRETRDPDSAVRYHRLAWDAYLQGDLPNDCMFEVMAELTQYWDDELL